MIEQAIEKNFICLFILFFCDKLEKCVIFSRINETYITLVFFWEIDFRECRVASEIIGL